MSTTHIQPLPNVRGRMSYTELGEGKKRTRNIREKTNRIAAQMGDMGTREDFIWFCSAMRRQSQGTRLNEGYELRVSWSHRRAFKGQPRGHPAGVRVRLCPVQGSGPERSLLGHGPHRRRGRLRARPCDHREP